jgi:hypothetical protein
MGTMNLTYIVRNVGILSSTFLTIFFTCISPAKSEQRACVITDEGNTVCGKLTNTNTKTKKTSIATVNRKEIDKISIVLKGCQNIDRGVKCDFVMRNSGAERYVIIAAGNGSSKIVDTAGKTHYSSTVDIDSSSGSGIGVKFSPDIDYAASMIFNNDRNKIDKAQLLEFIIAITGSPRSLKFSNISIAN